MRCMQCQIVFNDIKDFTNHLVVQHHANNGFTCPKQDCKRIFSRKDVFMQHFKLKHLLEKPVKKVNCVLDKTNSKNEDIIINNESGQCSMSCIKPDVSLNHNLDEPPFTKTDAYDSLFSKFSDSLNNAVNNLISQLYDNTTITKNQIQDFIDHFINFFPSMLSIF